MQNKTFSLCSSHLHILAMGLMLCDHVWACLLPQQRWLTCLGRIAFPIFAFLLVEGFCHTRNLKKYMLRMLVGAIVSEIPFDYMYSGIPYYPYHQNVMWTFLIALLMLSAIDTVRKKGKWYLTALSVLGAGLAGFLAGYALKSDYYGLGVISVLIFYFFRGRKWWCLLGQFACLYYVNVELLGGFYYPVTIFGHYFELMQQGLALFALIPIWLYRGQLGYHKKWFQYFCYGFYPGHMLVLYLLQQIVF